MRVVRHCHDLLTSLVGRPDDREGEVVAGLEVLRDHDATLIGIAVAVVVDAVVARFGRSLVDPVPIDLSVSVRIVRRVIAIAGLFDGACGNLFADANRSELGVVAKSVFVCIRVEVDEDAFVGLAVAVVVLAVADFLRELVAVRVGLVAVVAERGREAVTVQVAEHGLGHFDRDVGLGGVGLGRSVRAARGVGRGGHAAVFALVAQDVDLRRFAGAEEHDGHEDQGEAERIHRNLPFPCGKSYLALQNSLPGLTRHSPQGDFLLRHRNRGAFETPTNVGLVLDTRISFDLSSTSSISHKHTFVRTSAARVIPSEAKRSRGISPVLGTSFSFVNRQLYHKIALLSRAPGCNYT